MRSHLPGVSELSYAVAGLLTNLARSSKLALDYQRSHAASPFDAAKAFLRTFPHRLAQIARLGTQRAGELLSLEHACAFAGLGFRQARAGRDPPWWLPLDIFSRSASELPEHALIDPRFLSALCARESGHAPTAGEALWLLLCPGLLDARWSGTPLLNSPALPHHSSARIAVGLHLFYPDMWPEIARTLAAIPEPYDLLISVPEFACTPVLSQIAVEHPTTRFLTCPNRGRDILPFLRLLEMGAFDGYEFVCKLHSKRSPHLQNGQDWRDQLFAALIGTPEHARTMLDQMRSRPQLGMLGPASALVTHERPLHQRANRRALDEIASRARLDRAALEHGFFAGSMFWFRPTALESLRQLRLADMPFPLEMGQTDGTTAHAIERLICALVVTSGYHACSTDGSSRCCDSVCQTSP